MKKLLLFISIFLPLSQLKAQIPSKSDGQLYATTDLSRANGSPFMTEDWVKGTVLLQDGRVFKDIDVRYNDYNDQIYYKGEDGSILYFIAPVKEFTIMPADGSSELHFQSGFTNVPDYTAKSFFIVLGEGKTRVIKKVFKMVEERIEFPVTTPIKRFEESTKYFLVTPEKVVLIKNDKKNLLNALGNKQPELEKYIKQNGLNTKDDADLSKLITYYNSL